MTISLQLILFLLAFVCFVLAALQISAPRINLIALGLALWILGLIVRP